MHPRFKIILTLLVLAAMLVVLLVIPMFVIKRQETSKTGYHSGSPYKAACGERDIHQRGVLGDGEGG